MTDTSVRADVLASPAAPALSTEDRELVHALASGLIDVLDPLASAMAEDVHAQIPELGSDSEARAATRASCVANLREVLGMLRAGLLAETHETPPQALEHAVFQRRRGSSYDVVVASYARGLAMLRELFRLELAERVAERRRAAAVAAAVDAFLFTYVGGVLERLRREFDTAAGAWRLATGDPQLSDPDIRETARRFRHERIGRGDWIDSAAASVRAREGSARVLEEFAEMIDDAASDPEFSRRLSLAETTVEFVLADDPDLSVTLWLDRDPVEVRWGDPEPAEITVSIASFDLGRLCSGELKLPMAIARGRVAASGPVRKFLRVVPVLRPAGERHRSRVPVTDLHAPVDERLGPGTENGDSLDGSGFSAAQRDLLDDAAEYRYHSGALAVREGRPGDFWSVECIDVFKSFGRNRVLNGLNLGIPEGMITVILGPSGTGKSVLINHLIGLMFPDHGDILVHGRSVPNRRRSELFEMRRDFGILFQDGALFGSLNVYDNVAFPLREQTNKSEEEIRRIVDQRLEEVGLSDARHRMPSEISGGMKKRAGFARALVMEPKIVMFDEPDSGLDPVRTALLCELIRRVHEEHGGTYIVITHDIASARRLGDYIAVLWKGRIVESGDAERMFNSENPFVRQFLAGAADGPLGME